MHLSSVLETLCGQAGHWGAHRRPLPMWLCTLAQRSEWFRCLMKSPSGSSYKSNIWTSSPPLFFCFTPCGGTGRTREILSLGITPILPSYSLYGLTGSHPLSEKRENLLCLLVIITNLNILTGVPRSAETTVLAAAPATDSSCKKKHCGAQNRKSFQFCSSNWHNPEEGARLVPWGCRSLWVGPDSQGQPWLSWPLAETVPVGLQAILASLCLSPLPQSDLWGVSEFDRRHRTCLLTAPCAMAPSRAEPPPSPSAWRCFCLKL